MQRNVSPGGFARRHLLVLDTSPFRNAVPPIVNVVAVAIGGMIGASARYLILMAWPNPENAFPHTTFVENVAGAFLLGLLLMLFLHRWRWRVDLRPLVATGALGSFTTFSALSEEIVMLADEGRAAVAIAYAAGSVVAGLLAAGAGIVAGRALAGQRVRV